MATHCSYWVDTEWLTTSRMVTFDVKNVIKNPGCACCVNIRALPSDDTEKYHPHSFPPKSPRSIASWKALFK